MKVWETPVSKRKGLFKKLLCSDKDIINTLSKDEIKNQFNYSYHTKKYRYDF